MFEGFPGMTPGMGGQQDGLLNPRTMGLLGAIAALGKASGPSRMPVSGGQVLSEGLLGGLQGYQQGQQQAVMQRQIQQQEMGDKAKQDFAAKFPHLAPIMALDPKAAVERAYPKANEMFGKVDPKDYTPESIAKFAGSLNFADLQKRAAPLHFADTGSGILPVNPETGAPVGQTIPKNMTPDAQANLAFKAMEFGNLNANQRANLGVEMQRLGLSQKQLEEGRIQLVTDAEGNVHLVNKLTGVGTKATGQGGDSLKVAKPLTEVQAKANLFGTRADAADKILRGLEGNVSATGLAMKRGMESVPVIGGALGAIGNAALSSNQQKVEQAQRDFVNAVLRLESGAAISESEFNNARKQYFPQPGDSQKVIEQKKQNRATAIGGLRTMAGQSAIVNQPAVQQPQLPTGSAMTVNWSDLK